MNVNGGTAPAQGSGAVDNKRRVRTVRRRFTRRPDVHPGGVGEFAQPGPKSADQTVDFYDETTPTDLGTVAVDQSGNAALSIASLDIEDHKNAATYTPDGGSSQLLTGASAPLDQEIINLPVISISEIPTASVSQGRSGEFIVSREGGDMTDASSISCCKVRALAPITPSPVPL